MKSSLILLSSIYLACFSPALHAEVLYRQNFGTDSPDFIPFASSETGWRCLLSTNERPDIVELSEANRHFVINPAPGAPQNQPNVNAKESPSEEYGYFSLRNGKNTFYKALIFTTELSINQGTTPLSVVHWHAAGWPVKGTVRAAMCVDNRWYVSSPSNLLLSPDNNDAFQTKAKSQGVFVHQSEWFELQAELGGLFEISETAIAKFPAGKITAFGLLLEPHDTPSGHMRIDTFTVEGQ